LFRGSGQIDQIETQVKKGRIAEACNLASGVKSLTPWVEMARKRVEKEHALSVLSAYTETLIDKL
jgi:hypothetical protein